MKKRFNMSAGQTIAVGFALIILTGTLLLMLPISNRDGGTIPFFSSLFTATSATCVTGLVVFDTWTQFTMFGQAVILVLIQIGGLGFMTFSMLIMLALRRRIGLRSRSHLMESLNSMQVGGIVRYGRRILKGTFAVEGIGAVLFAIRFLHYFDLKTSIWFGIFHAVSAFCNAGFDLMGCIEPFTSLTPFAGDVMINLTVSALIIIGGIGFFVWEDVVTNKVKFKKYSLHSKIVLTMTGTLLILSTVLFLITERNTVLAGMPAGKRILASWFMAVTPRTAGFNSIDVAGMSSGGTFLTMLLMLIGAGAGSTAGGIKVSTFAVLIMTVIAYIKRHNDPFVFGRRIGTSFVRKAFCSTLFYIAVALTGCFTIIVFQDIPLKDAMFETLSAIGTVGMTTGITRSLSFIPRLVLILLMYSGRVGSLTIFMAVAEMRVQKKLRYPEEKIIIG